MTKVLVCAVLLQLLVCATLLQLLVCAVLLQNIADIKVAHFFQLSAGQQILRRPGIVIVVYTAVLEETMPQYPSIACSQ